MTPKEREALIAKAYSQIAEAQIALKLAELSLERIAAAETHPASPYWVSGTSTITVDLSSTPTAWPSDKPWHPHNIVKGTD